MGRILSWANKRGILGLAIGFDNTPGEGAITYEDRNQPSHWESQQAGHQGRS